jgi:putative ABC transport system permease protein
MLTADPARYFGILLGMTFASLLMTQQATIFCGVLRIVSSPIRTIEGGDVWVMDPDVVSVDEFVPLPDTALARLRGVPGARWAVPLYKGTTSARLTAGAGRGPGAGEGESAVVQEVILYGLDDATLVGAPRPEDMLAGSVSRLRQPGAVLVDQYSCGLLWPEKVSSVKRAHDYERFVGRTLEINRHHAVVVGVRRDPINFPRLPAFYTRVVRKPPIFRAEGQL